MGWVGQLTWDVKSDIRTLNFISDVTYAAPQKTTNDAQRRLLRDIKCQKMKETTNGKYT